MLNGKQLRTFRRKILSPFQGLAVWRFLWTLHMKAVCSTETSVEFTSWLDVTAQRTWDLHQHQCDNFKRRMKHPVSQMASKLLRYLTSRLCETSGFRRSLAEILFILLWRKFVVIYRRFGTTYRSYIQRCKQSIVIKSSLIILITLLCDPVVQSRKAFLFIFPPQIH